MLCLLLAAVASASWPSLATPPALAPDARGDAALIIAAEDYVFVPDVPGAKQNADDWYLYLKHARGVGTVKVLRDAEATRELILDAAATTAARVAEGGTLWVVYIGHGAPSRDGTDGVLVGADAQQTALSLYARSVGRRELLEAARGAQAHTVLVLDACFSGNTADGALVTGLQPLIPAFARAPEASVTLLTAGEGISSRVRCPTWRVRPSATSCSAGCAGGQTATATAPSRRARSRTTRTPCSSSR